MNRELEMVVANIIKYIPLQQGLRLSTRCVA